MSPGIPQLATPIDAQTSQAFLDHVTSLYTDVRRSGAKRRSGPTILTRITRQATKRKSGEFYVALGSRSLSFEFAGSAKTGRLIDQTVITATALTLHVTEAELRAVLARKRFVFPPEAQTE